MFLTLGYIIIIIGLFIPIHMIVWRFDDDDDDWPRFSASLPYFFFFFFLLFWSISFPKIGYLEIYWEKCHMKFVCMDFFSRGKFKIFLFEGFSKNLIEKAQMAHS